MNTFGYVGGNPALTTDKFGLFYSPSLEFGKLGKPRPLPTKNFSVGFGGSGMFMMMYGSADSGLAVDTSGNVCTYSTVCSGVGAQTPIAGELGIVGSVGSGELCTGQKKAYGAYVAGGEGAVVQGQIMQDGSISRTIVGIGGSPDGMGMIGAGGLECTTTYICQ